jgi:hypothetical protein
MLLRVKDGDGNARWCNTLDARQMTTANECSRVESPTNHFCDENAVIFLHNNHYHLNHSFTARQQDGDNQMVCTKSSSINQLIRGFDLGLHKTIPFSANSCTCMKRVCM